MSKNLLGSLVLAGFVTAATQAEAANVTFTGFAHGSETVQYSLSGSNGAKSGSVSAGGFATILDGGPTFETYCVDLYQTISFGVLYPEYTGPNTTHGFNNANAYADLSRLYARAGAVGNSIAEAAFQIAVWEIAYEKSTNAYNLASGDAVFFGGTAATAALGLATTWLTSLGGPGPLVQVLESRTHQDMIFATPVPEPETYALFLAGLGAVGFMTRRRATQERHLSA
ncbi:MAG TPA: PEP-CTERM sorting domain-containing protein [Caldimonas sp.]|jgi:hypothetical protein|nr:PEP-CTERM sorting domain-containing protein [Caldimonas sp.]HEX2540199.1 PEP-CTERM sorting domain-containing protein [Caldimonas sp.]